jgi:hypothetical protein
MPQPCNSTNEKRLPLMAACDELNMSRQGLLAALKRTGSVIRDDGHWFVLPSTVEHIRQARGILGLAPRRRPLRAHPQATNPGLRHGRSGKLTPEQHGKVQTR